MKKFLKAISALLACVMIFAMVGCDSKTTGVESEYDKKLTISITSNSETPEDSAAFNFLQEKFNVEFDCFYISEVNWAEKIRIWMSTGSGPDVMEASVQNKNYNEYMSWIDQGLIKEIPDLSKYPNLSKLKANSPVDPYFQRNGKTYAWVSYNPDSLSVDEEGNVKPGMNTYGYLYRADLVKELGLYKDVYTWDEFLEVARAMKAKYGQGFDPITMDAGMYPYGIGMMMYSPYWEQYKIVDGEYKWALDLPETWEGIKAANAHYHEGLYPEDISLYKSTEGKNKFKLGDAGIYMGNIVSYNVGDIIRSFNEANPDKKGEECIEVMKVLGPDGKMWGQYGINFSYVTMFNAEISDEKMERMLDIFEYIASEEGRKMVSYGIEGFDHTVENGKIKMKNEDMSIDGANPLTSKAMVRSYKTPDEISIAYEGQYTIDIVNGYKDFLASQDDSSYRRYDYEQYFCDTENYVKYGSYFYDGNELIKRLITDDPGKIEAEWNKWKDSVRPNVEKVIAELNSLR